jgi:hypothetical protein
MAPQTGTALLIIAVFVLPGFVTLLMRERTYRVKGQDSPFERLLNALYFSSIIYVVLGLAWVADGLGRDDISQLYAGHNSVKVYLLLAVIGLFVLPATIAELGRRWQKSRKLRPWFLRSAGIDPGHAVPAGWEQLFSESPGAKAGHGLMLRVTLDDGRVVGGYFGEKSLAGYTAHTRDLFIEEPGRTTTIVRMPEQPRQPIQKRGGISLPNNGFRPTQPPPKPSDAASSAKPSTSVRRTDGR